MTLAHYREYVQSVGFQEDTLRLIKEDLPAVAKAAAAPSRDVASHELRESGVGR